MFRLGRVTLLVDDLDATSRFYRDAFGFDILFDAEAAPGLRTIHLGSQGERGPGIWLLPASGASASRVGAQTGGEPVVVLYCDDLETELDRIRSAGVRIVKPLTRAGDSLYAHVLDDAGNEIVLAQLGARVSTDDYVLVE